MSAASGLKYADPITSGPTGQHTATVIFLHGLGDTGAGWADVAGMFGAGLPHVKFLFPTAPMRPITINMGMRMTGWYDIASLESINAREDADGLLESQRYIEELISKEVTAGVPSSRVVVGGFSQGGAVALLMLRSKLQLAGIVGLSTYVPLRNQGAVVSDENKATPVLLCHGTADTTVLYKYGQLSDALLREQGQDVTWQPYPGMAHSACPQELQAVQEFITKCLP